MIINFVKLKWKEIEIKYEQDGLHQICTALFWESEFKQSSVAYCFGEEKHGHGIKLALAETYQRYLLASKLTWFNICTILKTWAVDMSSTSCWVYSTPPQ